MNMKNDTSRYATWLIKNMKADLLNKDIKAEVEQSVSAYLSSLSYLHSVCVNNSKLDNNAELVNIISRLTHDINREMLSKLGDE